MVWYVLLRLLRPKLDSQDLAWSSIATTSRRDNKDQMIRPYVIIPQHDSWQLGWRAVGLVN
jgi:hypothetical protein